MQEDDWIASDRFIEDHLIRAAEAQDETLRANAAAGLPKIDVSAAQGKFLHLLALAIGARRILEIGTLGGYSTIWLARALGPDGGSRRWSSTPNTPRSRAPISPARALARGSICASARRSIFCPKPAGRGLWPGRSRLHRRRQGKQRQLLRLGARIFAPRRADRRRQCDPRRRGRRFVEHGPDGGREPRAVRPGGRQQARERDGAANRGNEGLGRFFDREGELKAAPGGFLAPAKQSGAAVRLAFTIPFRRKLIRVSVLRPFVWSPRPSPRGRGEGLDEGPAKSRKAGFPRAIRAQILRPGVAPGFAAPALSRGATRGEGGRCRSANQSFANLFVKPKGSPIGWRSQASSGAGSGGSSAFSRDSRAPSGPKNSASTLLPLSS